MPGYKLLAPDSIHQSLRCPQRMLWIVILCQVIPTPKSGPSICTEAFILQNLSRVSSLEVSSVSFIIIIQNGEATFWRRFYWKSHLHFFSFKHRQLLPALSYHLFTQKRNLWKGEQKHDASSTCRILAKLACKPCASSTRLLPNFCCRELPGCQQMRS